MEHYELQNHPDDSIVVIDNLHGSSYLDVSYKLPTGDRIMTNSIEKLLKESQEMS